MTEVLHRGQCYPAEALVMRFLQAHAQLLQDIQMEGRLDELEERIEGREGDGG